MIETSVVESLSRIVGEANLLSSPYDLDRYSADALTPFRAYRAGYAFERLADLVARPATVEEVSQIVTLAARGGDTPGALRRRHRRLWAVCCRCAAASSWT